MRRRSVLRALALTGTLPLAGCAPPGGERSGSIESLSVDLELNDEVAGDFPDAGAGTTSCVSVGPPPDTYQVRLRATVSDSAGPTADPAPYDLVVGIGGQSASTELTVPAGGTEEVRTLLLVDDDETFDPGAEATVRATLEREGETQDSVTRTAVATERNLRCADTPS